MPTGEYTVFAGRGFAYGIDAVRLSLRPGDVVRKTLSIRREVPTPGYASCDTHVHTLTHSGHGDATLDERVLTLAGEGVELPVATEHNRPRPSSRGVRQYFTPVVGNEVTTAVGHPTSPVVPRYVLGVTGAVWLDGDGDGKQTSAYEYASRLCEASRWKAAGVVQALAGYDEAVAAQAAGLIQGRGVSADPFVREADPQVKRGFEAFAEAWRESQVARSEKR
jgi:hypothetical protein